MPGILTLCERRERAKNPDVFRDLRGIAESGCSQRQRESANRADQLGRYVGQMRPGGCKKVSPPSFTYHLKLTTGHFLGTPRE